MVLADPPEQAASRQAGADRFAGSCHREGHAAAVESVEHLWQEDPGLQIVLCTAYSDYAWKDVLTRLDVRDRLLILKKPFDTIEIVQLVIPGRTTSINDVLLNTLSTFLGFVLVARWAPRSAAAECSAAAG